MKRRASDGGGASLANYRLNPLRMRLVKDGVPVKPGVYLQVVNGKPRSVKAAGLTQALAQGATLVIDEADDLYPPLRDVVVSLERTFRIPIQANLYAGWRTSKGFNLHWDSHDVLVLQVAGRKLWKVYEPTRTLPLRDDYETAPQPEKLVWEGTLCQGEGLYIPRGWWHVAHPLDEACLHLAVGLRHETGMDLVRWFADSLEAIADFRRDLPHWCSPAERAAHVETLRQQLNNAWSAEMMDRFFADKDSAALPRSSLFLPEAASPAGILLPTDGLVRVAASRLVEFSHDQECRRVQIKSCGMEWECSDVILPFLRAVNREPDRAHTIRELLATAPTVESRAEIQRCLREMVLHGVFVVLQVSSDYAHVTGA